MKSSSIKQETPQKFVAKIEHEHKICKVKKISLPVGGRVQAVPSTFDEAKAASKARKRKERQESVSSLYQERKVIRSNSEERPVAIKCTDNKSSTIRRVSSSGDFPKSSLDDKTSASPKRYEQGEKHLVYDDPEYDKRRSHERFARPHTIRAKKHGKRIKTRYNTKTKSKCEMQIEKEFSKRNTIKMHSGTNHDQNSNIEYKEKEQTNSISFLSLLENRQTSTSPIHTPVSPVLDFSTLHEQVDFSEPQLSRPNLQIGENIETMPSLSVATNRLLSSPRNSIIAAHRIYLDPDIPQPNISLDKASQNPIDERIQKLNKQINSHKRKIRAYEADFEAKNDYKPSQSDRMNDAFLRKLYAELSKFKKEYKQLSEISVGCSMSNLCEKVMQGGKPVTLQDTVNEMDLKLSQKREYAKRCYDIETMTPEELIEEKIAMQKALLFLESIHGRPQNKDDRDIVRPFYDRYRVLKRIVAKISNKNTTVELATIHENEAMNFVTPTSSSNDTESEKTERPYKSISTDSDTDTSLGENLHSLSKPELMELLKIATEEKKELRRKIKQWELESNVKTPKMLTKDDKKPMENVYLSYKKTKGRIKLLEALIAKQ